MTFERRKYAIVAGIAVLVAILAMGALSLVTSRTFYDPSTGRLRNVVTYQLWWGSRHRLDVLTIRDSVASTGVADHLSAHGRSRPGAAQWRWVSSEQSGLLGACVGSSKAPLVLNTLHWELLSGSYRPLLSPREFVGLLRLALHPDDNPAVNGLFRRGFLRQFEELEDAASKRALLRKELGTFWVRYVESSNGEDMPLGR